MLTRGLKGFNESNESDRNAAVKYEMSSIENTLNQRGLFDLPPHPFPWKKVPFEIEISSPLISRDPIATMFDQRNPDAVMTRKTVFLLNKDEGLPESEKRYFIKGETVRGIIRSLVAKNEQIFDLDHEDCDCFLCLLFGSIHQQGRLRFEDAEVQDVVYGADKKMDHVAIDRFTGGGVDRMKFDDYPLPGSPDKPVRLKGVFWVKTDIEEKAKTALKNALADLKHGIAAMGGLSAIGYGRIKNFQITDEKAVEWLGSLPESDITSVVFSDRINFLSDVKRKLLPENIYYPHYFLKPSEKVNRETNIISHIKNTDKNGENLLSGTITCKLITQGLVFIPDTENEDYFGKQRACKGHKNLGFFRINAIPAIPGSFLRGMI